MTEICRIGKCLHCRLRAQKNSWRSFQNASFSFDSVPILARTKNAVLIFLGRQVDLSRRGTDGFAHAPRRTKSCGPGRPHK